MWFIFVEIFFWISASFVLGFLFGWWGKSLLGFEKVSSRQVRYLRKLLIAERKENKELKSVSTKLDTLIAPAGNATSHASTDLQTASIIESEVKAVPRDPAELTEPQSETAKVRSTRVRRKKHLVSEQAPSNVVPTRPELADDNLAFGATSSGPGHELNERTSRSAREANDQYPRSASESSGKKINTQTASPDSAEDEHALSLDHISSSHMSTGVKDDLSAIKGIGPKLAQQLYQIGVERFAQIANMSDQEAEAFEQDIGFPNRIRREKWREQALDKVNSTNTLSKDS